MSEKNNANIIDNKLYQLFENILYERNQKWQKQ